MKERLHYIDIMKGITMLVVVLHHVLWITVDLKEVSNPTVLFLHGWQDMLASFIMPAFFFCTGYCSSFDKPLKTLFISNFKSLLIPSFTVGIAFELIYGRALELPATLNMCMHQGFMFFWFLYALFYGKMLFWLLNKFVKDWRAVLAILVVLAFVGTACNDHNVLGWNFMQYRQTFNLLLYLGVGHYFRQLKCQDCVIKYGSLAFLVGVALSRIVPFTIPKVTAGFNCTLPEEPAHIFFAMTGTLLMLWLSKQISHCLWLEEIGKKSLIIYVIHNTIIVHTTDLLFRDLLNGTANVALSLAIIVLMIAVATATTYYICVLLNTKYLKRSLGKF